ncbi:MAG: acetate--CoA ligase family protein [Deltaproteobacteria bacterium]|nr:acetate--CoA ligase family protein [Deltaproteobacteria bacterium]MBW2069200.1 acetate--CoA ligase family protein [Deltaproteobacteria bacterium]
MKRFFNAQSVTVIGVSNSPTNLGRAIVYGLIRYEFQGTVYLVGAKGGSFLGFKIYKSVAEVPETTDLAVLLVPARVVPDILEDCGRKGIKRVVVESGGFSELGDDRKELEERILQTLDRYDMRLIGPNCIGIINRHTGLALPFMPIEPLAPAGNIGIISQSGGVGGCILNDLGAEKLGYSLFASIGNKLNVNECDLLEYYLVDDKTKSIFCYLEGIADGRRMMEIAMKGEKPIVLHKSNRSEISRGIARSHSASLAVDDFVVSAACRQAGIIRVDKQSEAFTLLKGFQLPPVRGKRMGIISRSGGHAVIAADAAAEYGFELPPLPEDLIREVEKSARAGVIRFQNPLDLGDVFNLELYKLLAEQLLKNPSFDCVLFVHHYQPVFDTQPSRNLIRSIPEIVAKVGKPLALCVFSTRAEIQFNRENTAFPIFTDVHDAMKALAASRDYFNRKVYHFASRRPTGLSPSNIRFPLASETAMLDPTEAGSILQSYGFPLAPWKLAQDEESAVIASKELGYPVVIKTASPSVIHKTDAGGVLLNLKNTEEVREAYRKVSQLGRKVIIQKMVTDNGIEWIIGGKRDPQFGPVVLTGMGGVLVEIIKDVSARVGPICHEEAIAMLRETRAFRVLEGFRGQPRANIDALADMIVNVSWFLHDFPQIKEMDLNPVLITVDKAIILDWRIALC